MNRNTLPTDIKRHRNLFSWTGAVFPSLRLELVSCLLAGFLIDSFAASNFPSFSPRRCISYPVRPLSYPGRFSFVLYGTQHWADPSGRTNQGLEETVPALFRWDGILMCIHSLTYFLRAKSTPWRVGIAQWWEHSTPLANVGSNPTLILVSHEDLVCCWFSSLDA